MSITTWGWGSQGGLVTTLGWGAHPSNRAPVDDVGEVPRIVKALGMTPAIVATKKEPLPRFRTTLETRPRVTRGEDAGERPRISRTTDLRPRPKPRKGK